MSAYTDSFSREKRLPCEGWSLPFNLGNYILIYTNYVKTLHYICILCKKLLY